MIIYRDIKVEQIKWWTWGRWEQIDGQWQTVISLEERDIGSPGLLILTQSGNQKASYFLRMYYFEKSVAVVNWLKKWKVIFFLSSKNRSRWFRAGRESQQPGRQTHSIMLLCFPQYAAFIVWPQMAAPAPFISYIPVCRQEERGRGEHITFL